MEDKETNVEIEPEISEVKAEGFHRYTWRENAQKSLWTLLTVAAAIIFYYLIQSLGEITGYLGMIFKGISPVLWGLVFAYLLGPVARFYERNLIEIFTRKKPLSEKGPKRIRVASALLTLLTAIALITVLLLLVIPEIYNSITGIVKELPSQVDRLMVQLRNRTFFDDASVLGQYANGAILNALEAAEKWLSTELPKQAQTIGGYFFTGVKGAFSIVYNLVIGLIISTYVTIDKEKLLNQFKQVMFTILPTKSAEATSEMLKRGNKKLSAAIHGKIFDSFIIGVIHFILVSFANLLPWFDYPYPVLLAVIVGVTNVVPFFGPIVGGCITGLLVLFENPSAVIPYVIIVVALQQFDSSFLDPHIVGARIGLRPFWSIFGCLLGSAILGVPGFVLGPPVVAFVYEVASDWTDRNLRKKHLETEFGLRPEEEKLKEEAAEEAAEKIPEIRRFGEFLKKAKTNISNVIEKMKKPK